ncbi:MAG: RT0821/Lpp0805 family surface protein [Tardiphaga sp.]
MQSLHRQALYRTPRRVGLSAICPLRTALTAILIGTGLGGCSIGRHEGTFARMEGGDVTGSIKPQALAYEPTEADLALARTAASDVLTKGSKDSSQPWENPATGARGSVTPLAAAYTSEGRTCRDFLASYVHGTTESWLQGAACRAGQGRWDVRTLKPWKRA